MPQVLVIDHYDSYTQNLADLVFRVSGAVPDVVQHDRVLLNAAASYDRIILSPGPGNPGRVSDFSIGRDVLRAVVVPVFGVCLGMQGIVTTFGGRVSAGQPAHGVVSRISHDGKGIFEDVPQSFKAVRYHSLRATSIPPCLTACAWSEDGTVMAVRHQTRPVVGVQFHPESVLSEHGSDLLSRWLIGAA